MRRRVVTEVLTDLSGRHCGTDAQLCRFQTCTYHCLLFRTKGESTPLKFDHSTSRHVRLSACIQSENKAFGA